MPWTGCHGSAGGSSRRSLTGLDQLPVGRDRAGVDIDEEPGHPAPIVDSLKRTSCPRPGGRARRLRPLARARGAWRRRPAAPTAPTSASSPAGPRTRAAARSERGLPAPAPLRRAPVPTEREGGRALSPQSVARKLASIRAFFRHMVERGELAQNPADLVASPRRPRSAAQAAAHGRGGRAARPHSRPHAARAARPRAVRGRPTRAGCAARRS